MAIVKKIWSNFKTQPDIWFFYSFLLTSVLSVRKVLFFYPLGGQFNEYSGIYLYLSDIFLILTLISWVIFILYNNKYYLSIVKSAPSFSLKNISNMFHIKSKFWNLSHLCSTWNNSFRAKTHIVPRNRILVLILLLLSWIAITAIWAPFKNLEVFRLIKFSLYLGLFLYLVANVSRGTFLKDILRVIIFIALFEAILGISQFILQHSVGLFWLKESFIEPNLPGVAKIIVGGQKLIRAYGTFPHPNVLGGFLFHAIIITIFYKKMFPERNIVSRGTNNNFSVEHSWNNGVKCSTWNNNHCEAFEPKGLTGAANNVPRQLNTTFSYAQRSLFGLKWLFSKSSRILTILFISLFLTFSKSAWLALAISLIYIAKKFGFCETIFGTKTIRAKFFSLQKSSTWNIDCLMKYLGQGLATRQIRKFILLGLIFILLIFVLKPDINSLFINSLRERLFYLNVSRGTIADNFWLGTGAGQSVMLMDKYSNISLEPWQYQPVHNVFLLIWSELGIIGLVLFVLFLWKLFHVKQSNYVLPFIIFKGALLGLIFIMLFDHYLWDIQQGQIIFWLTAGILAGLGERRASIDN